MKIRFSSLLLLSLSLCAVLLFSACSSTAPATSSSVPASTSSSASSSTSQPPALPAGDSYRWSVQPSLAYNSLETLHDYIGNGTAYFHYLNIEDDGLWGIMSFDGRVIIEPTQVNADGFLAVCGNEHAHGGFIINGDDSSYKEIMKEAGFSLPFSGGHGLSGTVALIQHPQTQEFAILYGGYGYSLSTDLSQLEGVIDVLPFVVAPEEIQPDFSNFESYLIEHEYDISFPQYGLVDHTNFTVLLPCEYDSISELRKGYYTIEKDGKTGYFSLAKKQMITDIVYDIPAILDRFHGQSIGLFNDGYAVVCKNGSYGFINEKGEEIIPPTFEGATHVFEGKAWVKLDGLWGQIEFV